jgi:hypothetical protein
MSHVGLLVFMIKIIGDNYKIFCLILQKKSLLLDYGLSNATFEPPNRAFTPQQLLIQRSCFLTCGLGTMKCFNSL